MPILVIVDKVYENNRARLVTSHGYDIFSGKKVILPPVDPKELGARWSPTFEEWLIDENTTVERSSP